MNDGNIFGNSFLNFSDDFPNDGHDLDQNLIGVTGDQQLRITIVIK
jgi:hypothetical protein